MQNSKDRIDKYLVPVLVGGIGSIAGYVFTTSLVGTAVGFLLAGLVAYGVEIRRTSKKQ